MNRINFIKEPTKRQNAPANLFDDLLPLQSSKNLQAMVSWLLIQNEVSRKSFDLLNRCQNPNRRPIGFLYSAFAQYPELCQQSGKIYFCLSSQVATAQHQQQVMEYGYDFRQI